MKSIKQLIPNPVKSALWRTYNFYSDTIESLHGKREHLTPPQRMVDAVGGDFKGVGEAFLKYFIDLGELKPYERALDVGSGCGRMAVPLTKYLSREGSYEGFDIAADEVKWCQKNITPLYPNFQFQVADIYNKMYNRYGKQKASEYKFPYDDESFDFVILTSVLTHLLPEQTEHYLSETMRVLKKNGRCFVTYFLLNEESLQLIDAKKSRHDFKHDFGNYRVVNDALPEYAVGYYEPFIVKLYQQHNLEIKAPIYYGSWCDRPNPLSYQDIVIAAKLA